MPLPKPKDGEEKDEFLERCMGDSAMTEEYPDETQRYAVCSDLWEKKEDKSMETRKAIKSHKTATSDGAWDGPANESRLKIDQDVAFYAKVYAWRDPDGDESKKSSYKFIHHEVDDDGSPGAANIKACQTAIGVLNGARGGTTIPSEDKKGVWNHLASHLKDADVEPAELKEAPPENIEHRVFDVGEIRVVREDGKPTRIEGYSAVFNKESLNLGFFTEIIAPGAFKNSIKKSDTRALFNHDPNIVLGRKSAKTLRLKEDDKGLFMEVEPPDTQLVRDMVLTPIERGDITQQSFGFTVKKESWEEDKESGKVTRTLLEIEELYDVSPVTFPAYPDTSVALRSMAQWQKESHGQTIEPPEPGEIPKGWEDITVADAAEIRKEGELLVQKLRFMEVNEQ